jgi:hypothetical protein
MTSPQGLAILLFRLHGGEGMSFLLLAAAGVAFFVWALSRIDRGADSNADSSQVRRTTSSALARRN